MTTLVEKYLPQQVALHPKTSKYWMILASYEFKYGEIMKLKYFFKLYLCNHCRNNKKLHSFLKYLIKAESNILKRKTSELAHTPLKIKAF